ncbi:MAG TPA: glycoside hydrolase family 88 protein [Acidobacteriaceae bacterium]|nr:glycoside hydrolase family 88 protein [Acidobacteriaceae bacterium]
MKLKNIFLASLISATCAHAQSTQTVAAPLAGPSPATPAATSLDQAILLNGLAAEWQATANSNFAAIKSQVDRSVTAEGTLAASAPQTGTLDDLQLGRALVFLYRTTQEKKYALAAQSLYARLPAQPRTPSGLYAHTAAEPNQPRLTDSYPVEPFRAAYAQTFQQPQDFDDIANQLLLLDDYLRDPRTGLLHPAWDESKIPPAAGPADRNLGANSQLIAQPIALYVAALVDTLDWFPRDQIKRPALIAALQRNVTAILKLQDSNTGLWWQVIDRAPSHKPAMHRQPDGSLRLSLSHENDTNTLDPAASALFAYALTKAVRLGYLPASDEAAAQLAWHGLQKKAPAANPASCLAQPLSASACPPLLSGSFLLADSELGHSTALASNSPNQSPAAARTGLLPSSKDFHAPSAPQASTHRVTAMVDAWFNSQTRKNALGQTELFHYKWTDDSINGYSLFGRAFQHHNADLAMLPEAPTTANLAAAQVYVIASPDIPIKNPNPHYMDASSGDAIESWVRAGGVLILFMNDRDNTDFAHFNTLSDRFGIHFNPVLSHHVLEPDHSGGEVAIPAGTGIFHAPFTAYMKDTCTITPTGPAHAVVTDHGDVMIALSHLGKGTVLAIVDPWFYNEYADGRKMRQYRGFEAANDTAAWAVHQAQSATSAKP